MRAARLSDVPMPFLDEAIRLHSLGISAVDAAAKILREDRSPFDETFRAVRIF